MKRFAIPTTAELDDLLERKPTPTVAAAASGGALFDRVCELRAIDALRREAVAAAGGAAAQRSVAPLPRDVVAPPSDASVALPLSPFVVAQPKTTTTTTTETTPASTAATRTTTSATTPTTPATPTLTTSPKSKSLARVAAPVAAVKRAKTVGSLASTSAASSASTSASTSLSRSQSWTTSGGVGAAGATSASTAGTTSAPPFERLLKGAVFVISGIANPQRAELRDKLTELGAEYRAEWCPEATHLIAAFDNTPKTKLAVADGGTIVRPDFIVETHKRRQLVSIAPFAVALGRKGPTLGAAASATSAAVAKPLAVATPAKTIVLDDDDDDDDDDDSTRELKEA